MKNFGSFQPGAGLKILISGRPSVNFLIMPTLDGQGNDFNAFRHPYTNVLAPPQDARLKVVAASFAVAVPTLSANAAHRCNPWLPCSISLSILHSNEWPWRLLEVIWLLNIIYLQVHACLVKTLPQMLGSSPYCLFDVGPKCCSTDRKTLSVECQKLAFL